MTYGEAYFRPMVSLVKYLYENDYSVYIVSATYRDAVRGMTEGVLDAYIPSDRVIGTDLPKGLARNDKLEGFIPQNWRCSGSPYKREIITGYTVKFQGHFGSTRNGSETCMNTAFLTE